MSRPSDKFTCWRVVRNGPKIYRFPCHTLSCPGCRQYMRKQDTQRLLEKVGSDRLYKLTNNSRDYIRQKIKRLGGEAVFFPQENNLLIITNVPLGEEITDDYAQVIFEAFVSVAPGRRVCSSKGWHFSEVRPPPLPEPLRGDDEPTHGYRVKWDEFRSISESYGFRFLPRVDHYILDGLEEADYFTQIEWAKEVGQYELRPRRHRERNSHNKTLEGGRVQPSSEPISDRTLHKRASIPSTPSLM